MKRAEIDYNELKSNLAKMSEVTISMINDSIKALQNKDNQLAQNVIDRDIIVDELDIKIDESCMKIIALFEPKAADLRYIITCLRIIVDLERVGDHAKRIAKLSIKLSPFETIKEYVDLPRMAEKASKMVQGALEAYFEKNEKKALEIAILDDEIDALQKQINRELITYVIEDVSNIKNIIRLINITRRIERIADHAKNIAELVSFMLTGKILRHTEVQRDNND